MAETPPSGSVWAEVSRYPQVYIILGSPLETKDLVRAGVLTLSRAIIMRAPNQKSNLSPASDSTAEGYLTDADALFTYQVLHFAQCTAPHLSHPPHVRHAHASPLLPQPHTPLRTED